jgi:ubiquinone/menaquinone biosynthesis C-methylase UbiE
MNTADELKTLVRNKYTEIAQQPKSTNAASCCGCGPTSNKVYNIMMDDYTGMEGYAEEADLGLGCGLPTAFARIKPGDTVVDLGSGAGNDCFVARAETGATGKVIGVDFTPAMIQKARGNALQRGFNNVEFREGDLESMPIETGLADVVVSNCVLNLVPNKPLVMQEMFRILKPGGHFSISDIVLEGNLPSSLKEAAELYAGCVSGAIPLKDYLNTLAQVGFHNIALQKKKPILLPEDILSQYLDPEAIQHFLNQETGIFSVTVYGEKPGGSNKPKMALKDQTTQSSVAACTPQSNCC